jgi:HSP20 family molecular chaperone IbpA
LYCLRRLAARLAPKAEAGEPEWEEWCSWQGEGFDFPLARISETGDDVILSVETPGYQARDLEVTVIAGRVTVDGESETFHQKQDGPVFFAEFGERRMMRQFELPAAIRPETARATWQDGRLLVTARKACAVREARGQLAAAA